MLEAEIMIIVICERLAKGDNLTKILENKLGQCQSHTPISSAFWVQKEFGLKSVGSKKF